MKHPRMTVHFEWASRDIKCTRRMYATNFGVQGWVWSIVILISCHPRKRTKSQWIPIWIASLDDSWARMTMLHTQRWASEVVACTFLMHLKSPHVHLVSVCHAHCMVMRATFVLVALYGVDTKQQGYERFLHISTNFLP